MKVSAFWTGVRRAADLASFAALPGVAIVLLVDGHTAWAVAAVGLGLLALALQVWMLRLLKCSRELNERAEAAADAAAGRVQELLERAERVVGGAS